MAVSPWRSQQYSSFMHPSWILRSLEGQSTSVETFCARGLMLVSGIYWNFIEFILPSPRNVPIGFNTTPPSMMDPPSHLTSQVNSNTGPYFPNHLELTSNGLNLRRVLKWLLSGSSSVCLPVCPPLRHCSSAWREQTDLELFRLNTAHKSTPFFTDISTKWLFKHTGRAGWLQSHINR